LLLLACSRREGRELAPGDAEALARLLFETHLSSSQMHTGTSMADLSLPPPVAFALGFSESSVRQTDEPLVIVVDHRVGAIRLRHLAHLDASWLAGFDRLMLVDLRGTRVTNLQALARLQNLRFVDLSGSQLDRFPPLESLPALVGIVATHNSIREVGDLGPHIEYADLSFNQLSALPRGGTALRHLVLESNPVDRISPTHLPRLEALDLAFCRVAEIEGLAGMPQLRSLQLWANRVHRIPDLPAQLRYVGLGQNPLDPSPANQRQIDRSLQEGPILQP
jgi:Leucine-rich repeat (LRR) protein